VRTTSRPPLAELRPGRAPVAVVVSVTERCLRGGLGYGAALYATNVLHSVGRIIAGRIVGTPVDAVVVTSTRDVIIYINRAPPRRPAAGLAAPWAGQPPTWLSGAA